MNTDKTALTIEGLYKIIEYEENEIEFIDQAGKDGADPEAISTLLNESHMRIATLKNAIELLEEKQKEG